MGLSKKIQIMPVPGTVVIIVAGRFGGKRVVVLKSLGSRLLISGPYKVNGVPIRRVYRSIVINTTVKVDLTGLDMSCFNENNIGHIKNNKQYFSSALAQYKQKRTVLEKALIKKITSVPKLTQYLTKKFTIQDGMPPHRIKF